MNKALGTLGVALLFIFNVLRLDGAETGKRVHSKEKCPLYRSYIRSIIKTCTREAKELLGHTFRKPQLDICPKCESLEAFVLHYEALLGKGDVTFQMLSDVIFHVHFLWKQGAHLLPHDEKCPRRRYRKGPLEDNEIIKCFDQYYAFMFEYFKGLPVLELVKELLAETFEPPILHEEIGFDEEEDCSGLEKAKKLLKSLSLKNNSTTQTCFSVVKDSVLTGCNSLIFSGKGY